MHPVLIKFPSFLRQFHLRGNSLSYPQMCLCLTCQKGTHNESEEDCSLCPCRGHFDTRSVSVGKIKTVLPICDVIYQTREGVFHQISKH